jgi:hypothetical protein
MQLTSSWAQTLKQILGSCAKEMWKDGRASPLLEIPASLAKCWVLEYGTVCGETKLAVASLRSFTPRNPGESWSQWFSWLIDWCGTVVWTQGFMFMKQALYLSLEAYLPSMLFWLF